MEALQKQLSKIRVPCSNQPIYKDECVYSYDNPESPTGLYVSLSSFLGFGEAYVRPYAEKSGNLVFLHIRREKHLLKSDTNDDGKDEQADESGGPERKITRLAIGLEGGYTDAADKKKYEYKDTYTVVVLPNTRLPYPSADLPLLVTQCVEAILTHDSAIAQLEKQALTGTWDGEVRQVSKHCEDLEQLDNGKKIPPSGWKCEKCDLTTNLWLNLTDGAILCGRRFFDGSGGNEHASEHYKQTKYPLAVKLGTISAEGKSDVFSYPEDDMVVDSKLEQHLAHFGINMAAMKKSEKSMVELELEINQRIGEWSLLTESDSELQPLAGAGYTGMRNLGNSCYINSVMQVLFTIPDFVQRFVGDGAQTYFAEYPPDPANEFNIQMAKLGSGLWSGRYSSIAENALDSEATGIAPAMFKHVVGRNHPDFSTKQQQDAYDFYLHLINLLDRHSRHHHHQHQSNPAEALRLCVEDRIECTASKRVKYTRRDEYCLPLEVPLERAINLNEVKAFEERRAAETKPSRNDKDTVRHKVPLQSCLEAVFAPERIEQFYSTAIKGRTTAQKTTRLANMPDYLMMHVRKFILGDDWVPKKLDVEVLMPEELDLSAWRAKGLQAGEQLLPETAEEEGEEAGGKPKFVFDEAVMSQLMQMGFPAEACKRAVFFTKNAGLEVASNWLMEHIADNDISEPFVVPNEAARGGGRAVAFEPDPESLALLMSMGFDLPQATKALKATEGNVERATDWIFSHVDDMDTDEAPADAAAAAAAPVGGGEPSCGPKAHRDGGGKYRLAAFISHMGTSTQVGHYVCHIRKDGQWVIFNDSKVALSQNPPLNLGYLYLYQRID